MTFFRRDTIPDLILLDMVNFDMMLICQLNKVTIKKNNPSPRTNDLFDHL